jgi:hypothetical protein
MSLFSQRKGIRPVRKAIQSESIDSELRNQLWSAIKLSIWDQWSPRDRFSGYQSDEGRCVEGMVQGIWLHYFKLPADTVPGFQSGIPKSAYEFIRDRFFGDEWWGVYDFLEFLIKAAPTEWAANLGGVANVFLEAENAAYRIVDKEIVEITDKHEIGAIESAIDEATKSVRSHLQRALELLSDRKNHDYRNSIKESISAVESACRAVSGNPKGTLGECLKTLKTNAPLHPALEGAFLKLYGYTSDQGGIRHALADSSDPPSFADAKFMLVACSAFTNFLWTKASENGVKIHRTI